MIQQQGLIKYENRHDWKKLMKQMKLESTKQAAPNFFIESGGYGMFVRPYAEITANTLTRTICDFITFSGGEASRINTQGQIRKIRGEMKFTKGSGRKGSADIRATYKGRSISIEVKIGKDKMSEQQIKERERITNAGGLYFVAKNFNEFLEWWQENGFPIPWDLIKK